MAPDRSPILIGCSGWSYDDWRGPFYPDGLPQGEYLEHYADRFPIVEVDSTFYRPPSPVMVRGWARRTPDDFSFVCKVPRAITHEKLLRDCDLEVEGFVGSILPLGSKLRGALLQLGYFNRAAFGTLDDFLGVLGPFLASWPMERVPLAVEIRNPRWMVEAFTDLLRRHGAALTLTEQQWMPHPAEIESRLDPVTGPFSMVRLLGDRQAIERVTTTWDKIVLDRSAELERTAGVIRRVAGRVPVHVFANNHYAGYSPATADQLRGLLGVETPEPPPRPRTTLFD